jgi:uncharacterized protein (DUF1501 family)
MKPMLTRRDMLHAGLAVGLSALAMPVRVALAAAPTDRRFVFVILRGGLDGLAAVPPFADPDYARAHGDLALAVPGGAEGASDLDGSFGLHPALSPLSELYAAGELAVFHAVATPYRERSHFDAQDLLENGTASPHGAGDGWLNRTLAALGSSERLGLAVGHTVPLALRGEAPVVSWSPQVLPAVDSEFLARLAVLYQDDRVLGPAFAAALAAEGGDEVIQGMAGLQRANSLAGIAEPVGAQLAAETGPRIAVLELGGWDTHAQQGAAAGRLARALAGLAEGLAALQSGLGQAWSRTAVLVATEFGRTVAVNGTDGTDHGTATAAFLLGGAVAGGRVIVDWPGLASAALYEGRDLAPTLDLRAVEKAILADHLQIAGARIESEILPDSGGVGAIAGLFA